MDYRDVASHKRKWYRDFDEKAMEVVVELNEEDITIPVVFEVCPTCLGKGKYVNPSIDAQGIGMDEWCDWGEEERYSYSSGAYDITCCECNGKRVVPYPSKEMGEKQYLDVLSMMYEYDQYAREKTHELEMGY